MLSNFSTHIVNDLSQPACASYLSPISISNGNASNSSNAPGPVNVTPSTLVTENDFTSRDMPIFRPVKNVTRPKVKKPTRLASRPIIEPPAVPLGIVWLTTIKVSAPELLAETIVYSPSLAGELTTVNRPLA